MVEVMFLRCGHMPIDTTPPFNPMVSMYTATLDWKMRDFSVQAQPVAPGIIDNIHLCHQEADCQKQDQRMVAMDFSNPIAVDPGAKVLYMFDVLLAGTVRSYTLIVERLQGSETTIRHIILAGGTIDPDFREDTTTYRAMLGVGMEVMRLELHLADAGQTVFATADEPMQIGLTDNITELRNDYPGNTRSPPTRLRRLREESYGEFQYPNKYFNFPVPLASSRLLNLQVMSADGGHRGWYQLQVARFGCTKGEPLFDAVLGRCVRFCAGGFWADLDAKRCKLCPSSCLSCLSPNRCIRCPLSNSEWEFPFDNKTNSCDKRRQPFWKQHHDFLVSMSLLGGCLLVFCCGVGLMRCTASRGKAGRSRASSTWETAAPRRAPSAVAGAGYGYAPVAGGGDF